MIHDPATILAAIAAGLNDTGRPIPVFSIWNAFVVYIPEGERERAARRFAATVFPDWERYL